MHVSLRHRRVAGGTPTSQVDGGTPTSQVNGGTPTSQIRQFVLQFSICQIFIVRASENRNIEITEVRFRTRDGARKGYIGDGEKIEEIEM